MSEWLTLNEFKINYIDRQDIIEKGIIKDYKKDEFENQSSVRNMHNITYRFMNFLLYSYILGSFFLENINENDIKQYLVEDLFPQTLFGLIINNWKLLSKALKEIKIENIQLFLNVILENVIELISEYKSFDTVNKMLELEKKVNKFIMEKISTMNNILINITSANRKETKKK